MRLHTALHLLSCVMTAPVTGGNIVPEKRRLDFDIELSQLTPAHIEREQPTRSLPRVWPPQTGCGSRTPSSRRSPSW